MSEAKFKPVEEQLAYLKKGVAEIIRENELKAKLEESLKFLQRNEEKLWFWGVDRSEDLGFSAEFLKEAGLQLDRRNEFPRKAANLSLEPERDVPAFVLGPVRRGLAEAVEFARIQPAGD